MRYLSVLLLTAFAANASDVLLHRIHHPISRTENLGYRKIEFRVDDAALKEFGEWEPVDGKPAAVTRNEAVKLALESAGIEPGTPAGEVLVSLENINEWDVGKKTLPAGCSPWFYVIQLRNAPPDPKDRYFLVTVGGTLAKATVADRSGTDDD